MNLRFLLACATFTVSSGLSHAADPAWWAARGVKNTSASSNRAPATIGQAKHVAAMALAELQTQLSPEDYQALYDDVAAIGNLAVPQTQAEYDNQRHVLLLGQLKAMAKPFYDRLRTLDAPWLSNEMISASIRVTEPGSNPITYSPYPWSVAVSDDQNKAVATLGQLKAVFSLRLESIDTDHDGIRDTWELRYFPNLDQTFSDDPDGDGLSNTQELALGFNPTVSNTTTDTDGDGMLDTWELNNALNPNDIGDGGADDDQDGLTNLQEYQAETNPHDYDTDNDFLPDGWEIDRFLNFNQTGLADPDGDGLPNQLEYALGFDPQNAATNGTADASKDRDGDGMPDAWEASFGRFEWDPDLQHHVFHCLIDWNQADSGADPDSDGLTNLQEYQAATNPADYDTDDDWLPDVWEIQHFSNLSQAADGDPDGDGIHNWVEYILGFDPMDLATGGTPDSTKDTDEDGMPDAWEAWFGQFKWDASLERNVFHQLTDWNLADDEADPDGDNLTNIEEYEGGTDPGNSDADVDTDNDSLPDSWEIQYFSNLSEAAEGDPDGDGVPNWVEYVLSFDPLNPETDGTPDAARDTDGDGMPDAWEASFGHFEWDPDQQCNIFHPLTDWNIPDDEADSDGDGFTNLQEFENETNPGTPEVQSEGPPQVNAIPKYEIISYSKTEFTYYLPQVVSINPTAGNSVTYTTDGTNPRNPSSSGLTVSALTKITCQASVTIRATASEYANDPTYDEIKYVQVTTDETNFNLLNRRPRYCLRVDPYSDPY